MSGIFITMIKSLSNFNTDKSIAVLPFINMSDDIGNEYFSDGISEEIINALTRVDGLKVIARTSAFAFKGKNEDVRTIGKQLGVSSVLEGSVRKAGQKVRITAQLINTADGTHYWSRNFDRQLDDIFALQDEVSLLIAEQIRQNFGHLEIQDHLVKKSTSSVNAYELFLKGRFHQLKWNPESFKKAIGFYNHAIEQDNRFARAYYGNVQCYGLLAIWGFMPYEEAIQKAMDNLLVAQDIDKKLPEYNQSYIGRSLWAEWNYPLAYQQINELLALNPDYTDGLEAMAELLMANGYFTEAEKYIRKCLVVDPLSANHFHTLGLNFYLQKHFEEALKYFQKAINLDPGLEVAKHFKLLCLIRLGYKADFKNSLDEVQDGDELRMLFDVFNSEAPKPDEPTINKWKKAAASKDMMVPYELYILAGLNLKTEALVMLKEYVDQRRGQLMYFRYEPFLENLRDVDGFDDLFSTDFVLRTPPSIQEKDESKIPGEDLKKLMKFACEYISTEKPFLDPQLSLSGLAAKINVHPNKLSYLINDQTGSNFNEFINRFRLEHFKQVAMNPEFSHITILGLAFESGFNSKTVFNTFFKKMEGTTPASWIKSARAI